MTDLTLQTLPVNGIRMRVAVQGSGPLVLLCHGFPEGWVLVASADGGAGRRRLPAPSAPDMRGYGGTDAPADPAQYTMLHHVGDLVGLVQALGEEQAVDRGPRLGRADGLERSAPAARSVPRGSGSERALHAAGPLDLLGALEKLGVHNFYMQYFQTPGVAEAELEADVAATIRRATYSLSGDGAGGVAGMLLPGTGFLHNTVDPAQMPAWLNADDLSYTVAEFERTGFRGGLNWYRSIRLTWELMAPWRGAVIHQPSLFIGGSRDDVLKFPTSRASIDRFNQTLPGLRGSHILEGAGHWIQRERADAVNALLLEFLAAL